MAGLWTTSNLNSKKSVYSCAIITKPSQHTISKIHHRMPYILHLSDVDTWLNCIDNSYSYAISKLSHSDIELEYYAVSKAINYSFYNNPELLDPSLTSISALLILVKATGVFSSALDANTSNPDI